MTWIAGEELASSAPHLREAPVFSERTSVGLDVELAPVFRSELCAVRGRGQPRAYPGLGHVVAVAEQIPHGRRGGGFLRASRIRKPMWRGFPGRPCHDLQPGLAGFRDRERSDARSSCRRGKPDVDDEC